MRSFTPQGQQGLNDRNTLKIISRHFKILLLVIGLLVVLIGALFGYRDIPLAELKAAYAPLPSAFVRVDGMSVHYRDEGNPGDSLPLVLIHGTGSSLHTFDDWSAALKSDYRVVRMDLPAFGLTGPFPDRDYSIERYVLFVERFLAELGIEKCIIGGNSLGGEIAWQYAVKNPGAVERLILINAAGYPKVSQSEPLGFTVARIPVLNKLLTFITPKAMVRASVENVYADRTKVTDELVDRYFDLILREGNRQALADRMMVRPDTSNVQLIKDIQQPALVLWGEQDYLIPVESAYRFHNDLANDTLVVLKNVGHVPMEERPKESLEVLLAFLKYGFEI